MPDHGNVYLQPLSVPHTMSSAEKTGDPLGPLTELLGTGSYPREKVLQQTQRLQHIRRAIEEKVGLEDPMPLHGMVSRHEGP